VCSGYRIARAPAAAACPAKLIQRDTAMEPTAGYCAAARVLPTAIGQAHGQAQPRARSRKASVALSGSCRSPVYISERTSRRLRFDMGERDSFVGVPTALAALELGASWSRDALRQYLARLTGHIAAKLSAAGFDCLPEAVRSPHILGVRGLPDGVATICRARNLFFSQRHACVRISPHMFNSVNDADRCVDVLIEAALAATRNPRR
jgi:hypothetical protein